MADPGDGNLAVGKFGEGRLPMLPGSAGEQCFPYHFMEKCARIEMFRWREIFERSWEWWFRCCRAVRLGSLHKFAVILLPPGKIDKNDFAPWRHLARTTG